MCNTYEQVKKELEWENRYLEVTTIDILGVLLLMSIKGFTQIAIIDRSKNSVQLKCKLKVAFFIFFFLSPSLILEKREG